MIRSTRKSWLLCCLLILAAPCVAGAVQDNCRPIRSEGGEIYPAGEYTRGLLWEIHKPGTEPSYLFGTIHVANNEIEDRLSVVTQKLIDSRIFAMEALPEPEQVLALQRMMFFADMTRLNSLVPEEIYRRAVEILSGYHINEEVIARMKPWAAYVTMSYPASMARVLDVQLLELARESGAELHGLETMQEQGEIFTSYTLQQQAQLLVDTVCHYHLVEANFSRMIELYLDRDLEGLYLYGQRYFFDDNTLYEDLTERILTERNVKMVQRMQPLLEQGDAFIAVGAMHLPGEAGILALLKQNNYTIKHIE